MWRDKPNHELTRDSIGLGVEEPIELPKDQSLGADRMPIVLRVGPYRIGFWSKENNEPPHVHVRRERFVAKYWIEPLVELADNQGFAAHELTVIRRIVELHREQLLEAWHEHFDNA